MSDPTKQNPFRAIPPVDEVLDHPDLAGHRRRHPVFPWTRIARNIIDSYRADPRPPAGVDPADRDSLRAYFVDRIRREIDSLQTGGQKRVINGTGVILHTNLGRAVTGRGTVDAVSEALSHYVSLEIDLESGQRTRRSVTLNRLVALATGAEDAMVVNNNAAAVYMVVNSVSPPGRVIVSRGELVEIGGSFRLPEILRHAASDVIEVGTTNRTYAEDYSRPSRPGDVFLKVHKSNYAMEGFVCEASIGDLTRLAAKNDCFVVYDLGSGAVFDFRSAGIGHDDHIRGLFETGVDCVTMSGDKLLGSVQAGIIAGKAVFLDKLRQNPLRRAVRIDKVNTAALQEVFRNYLFGSDAAAAVPVIDQILGDLADVDRRAGQVAARINRRYSGALRIDTVGDDAAVGGGSLAAESVPSVAVRITCAGERETVRLARRMRLNDPPVVPRTRGNEIRINMRSVMPYEDEELAGVLGTLLGEFSRES
jgi:L-seryl-tRNA(Ser) seleniumtransferase